MTYHLTPQPYPVWSTGLLGLGAFGAAEVPSACTQWITSHYDAAEYERIRTQELPQLLAEMPQLSASIDALVGKPLPWSLFSERWYPQGAATPALVGADSPREVTIRRRGASGLFGFGATNITGGGATRESTALGALQQREYDAFLLAVLQWTNKVVGAFNRMGIALNLPTCWLLPSNPNTPHTALPPAADQVIVDFTDPVPPKAGSYGRVGEERISGGVLCPNPPLTIHWRNLPFALLHATLSGTKPDTWYGTRRNNIPGFWRSFRYDNTPATAVGNRAGYPEGARHGYSIDIPPAVARRYDHGSWLSAEKEYSDCKVWAGPIYMLWYAREYLRIISQRPAAVVLGNAFETWAGVLTVWAGAPANRHSTADKDKMKTAAAGLKLAATTFTGAGAVATASGAGAVAGIPMMVFGAAMTAFSEILKILPAAHATMSSCTGDKAKDAAMRLSYHTTLGFCGPPTPLMFNPPDGCKPTDALTFVSGGGLPGRDKSWWDQIKPYLTHPAFIGAVGLIAAFGAYRVFAPKTTAAPAANYRQRRPYRRHNRGF